MNHLKLYKNLLECLVNLLDISKPNTLPEVTTLEMSKPRKKKKRKPTDTYKFTTEQQVEIWSRYQQHLQYNTENPLNRHSFAYFVQTVNTAYGTNKSTTAIKYIINDMGFDWSTPSHLQRSTQEHS